MAGKISEHPLAELMCEASIEKLTGALRLERERVKAAIYFEEGKTVFAAANIKSLRLSTYLKNRKLISDQQLTGLGQGRMDSELANDLVDKGILDRSSLETVFAKLVSDIVSQLLMWKEGSWEYDDKAQLVDSPYIKIDTASALIEAARKFDPQFVASRLLNFDEMISPTAEDAQYAYLMPTEAFVLSRVDRPLSLREVRMLSGLDEADALRAIYGLIVAGYLRRESFTKVLHTSPAVRKQTAQPPPAVPTPPPKPIVAEPEIAPGLTEEEELEAFFTRIDKATDHYAVLDLSRSAEVPEIKRSYYRLAKRFHPDRFHAQADVHARTESAFARITHAYETLTHAARKSAYDLKLAAEEKAREIADSAPKRKDTATLDNRAQNAEKSFRDGYAALQLGQTGVAITQLAAAAKAAPKEPRYRAYYGQALATDGRSQKLAEAELQAAVRLEPTNATYRMMLAELFYQLTFYKRAHAEVARVLELEPRNSEARALLKKLQGTK